MSKTRPCPRCERELPLSEFDHPKATYCKACAEELSTIVRKKYGIIASAHFRAKLRQQTRHLHERNAEKANTGS